VLFATAIPGRTGHDDYFTRFKGFIHHFSALIKPASTTNLWPFRRLIIVENREYLAKLLNGVQSQNIQERQCLR